jgi:hypothetical protein
MRIPIIMLVVFWTMSGLASAGDINEPAQAGFDQRNDYITGILIVSVLLLALIVYRLLAALRKVRLEKAALELHALQQMASDAEDDYTSLPEVEDEEPLEPEESGQHLYGRMITLRGIDEREILITEELFTIGRSADECDYVINKPYISPAHCKLVHRNGDFFIEDMYSKNGIFINGERIPRDREVVVPISSEIEITKHIAFELWDPDTEINLEAEITNAHVQEDDLPSYEDELVFKPLMGVTYAADNGGEVDDSYSPI